MEKKHRDNAYFLLFPHRKKGPQLYSNETCTFVNNYLAISQDYHYIETPHQEWNYRPRGHPLAFIIHQTQNVSKLRLGKAPPLHHCSFQ